ncbi:hypothetical protein Tco_1375571 [Tanacetum coccineum]
MTTITLPPQPQQVSSDSILLNRLGELEQHIADLVDVNQALEERLDKHVSRLYRLENQDIPNQVSKAVDEIVTDAVEWAMHAPLRERFRDLPEADMKEILPHKSELKKKKKRQSSPKTPSSSPPHPHLLTTIAGTFGNFKKPLCFGCLNHHLLLHLHLTPGWYNVSKPLPLGGDLGHVTIQPDFFFNKDLEYLRYGCKIGRPALSISKMKAAYYPDVGLEQMVRIRCVIEEDVSHDVAAIKLGHQTTRRKIQLGIESYQMQLNLTKPRWDAKGFEYKHDFTIDEGCDYRVKDIQGQHENPGLDTRFCDEGRRRQKQGFMFAIQK